MHRKLQISRIAGFLYLLIIGFGLIAQVFVRDNLVHYNDAAITADNIAASELWFRFGFVCELMMLVSDIGVTTILYLLLKDVSKGLSLLSTFFRIASICILGVTALTHYAALFFLDDAGYLTAFTPGQLEALALFSIKLHGAGYNISLVFFGCHLVIFGYLLLRSGILPRFIGGLLLVAGVCYYINSLIWFLFPALVKTIYPAILVPCFIGELLLSLWLLIKGVSKPSRTGQQEQH